MHHSDINKDFIYPQLSINVIAMSSLNQMRGQLRLAKLPLGYFLVPSDGVVLSFLNNKHYSYQLPFQTLRTRERFS